MQFEPTEIPTVFLVHTRKFCDARGFFIESFRQSLFDEAIGHYSFVQDNHSLSKDVGVVRGLHFQLAPAAQGKLVRCIAGAILDVAVDIRRGSPTFGTQVARELSAANGSQLWVPPGFAHGFCTLEPNTEVVYKVTNYYSSAHDRGLLWNDPALNIAWPVSASAAILSEKDKMHPRLSELEDAFTYGEI
ncbi:dTDP-4-dehydrorhamnose 3,5-epimerase [Sinorhizobium numidicum]|uniref:dTDP-4-dehydrorhamnose 3,5-epimerase n=2 Tax=Sinorhizobium numidicum TaxID=680248 RepID=A0ABY8CYC8_9HYPH|nr:dTDP-4-dehydrorhamnose 3,5-epimerase [Sinorhizobium numidicum]WEX75761.1 dTDP-4-dehydrorhamnose 3,5-epimerase [Sinorhizobium numidicum]WEX81748.1 dTDP-4-dehydrorhamnose 3,5-epimerase [Sinorhizobium numidicum]